MLQTSIKPYSVGRTHDDDTHSSPVPPVTVVFDVVGPGRGSCLLGGRGLGLPRVRHLGTQSSIFVFSPFIYFVGKKGHSGSVEGTSHDRGSRHSWTSPWSRRQVDGSRSVGRLYLLHQRLGDPVTGKGTLYPSCWYGGVSHHISQSLSRVSDRVPHVTYILLSSYICKTGNKVISRV